MHLVRSFLVILFFLLFVTILNTNGYAEQVTEEDVLELPTVDLLGEGRDHAKRPSKAESHLSFTEEASGKVDLLINEDVSPPSSEQVTRQGPRILPSQLEKGIGQGLKGIGHITSPITKPRELTGPGKDTVIEFDPSSKKRVKIEF